MKRQQTSPLVCRLIESSYVWNCSVNKLGQIWAVIHGPIIGFSRTSRTNIQSFIAQNQQ